MFRKSVISITCSILIPFLCHGEDAVAAQQQKSEVSKQEASKPDASYTEPSLQIEENLEESLEPSASQAELEVEITCAPNQTCINQTPEVLAQQAKEKAAVAVNRELNADEDPLNKQIAEKLLRDKEVKEAIEKGDEQEAQRIIEEDKDTFELYGSIYTRYRSIEGVGSSWQDNGSRIGVNGHYQTDKDSWLFGRYELGFNLLDELKINRYEPTDNDDVYILDGKSIHTRLAYIGFQSKHNTFVIGKNWSTYYQIAGFTDRFDSMGGEAAGAYNAGTDGGAAGTGKADNVIQTRLNLDLFSSITNLKPLSVNVQLQHGEEIPGLENSHYGISYGLSTIIEAWSNISFGIAYNQATLSDDIDFARADLRSLSGDMKTLLVGARWFNDDWFIGATMSKSQNMHTADNNQYFSGIGAELYGQYQFRENLWLLAGFNKLKPDDDQLQASHYALDYTVLGMRYSIEGFSRMFYFESRIDQGTTFDNKKRGNQLALGLRWGF